MLSLAIRGAGGGGGRGGGSSMSVPSKCRYPPLFHFTMSQPYTYTYMYIPCTPPPPCLTMQVGSTLEVITWNGTDRKFCDIVETGEPIVTVKLGGHSGREYTAQMYPHRMTPDKYSGKLTSG